MFAVQFIATHFLTTAKTAVRRVACQSARLAKLDCMADWLFVQYPQLVAALSVLAGNLRFELLRRAR